MVLLDSSGNQQSYYMREREREYQHLDLHSDLDIPSNIYQW